PARGMETPSEGRSRRRSQHSARVRSMREAGTLSLLSAPQAFSDAYRTARDDGGPTVAAQDSTSYHADPPPPCRLRMRYPIGQTALRVAPQAGRSPRSRFSRGLSSMLARTLIEEV